MLKFPILSLALAGISAGAAAPAFASDKVRCNLATGATRLSQDEVKAKLAEAGYKVARIKSERGCYEVHATDKGGTAVALRVDPATAKVLRTKQDD